MISLSNASPKNLDLSKRYATIFCYHGVTTAVSYGIENYSGKHISKFEFISQLKFIKKYMNPVSLGELGNQVVSNNINPRTIAITFDDGYQNVYDVAWPLLKEYQIPATIFICPGFVDVNRVYWVDLLEHWINKTELSEINLSVSIDIQGKYILHSKEQKIDLVRHAKKVLKSMQPAERENALFQIKKACQVKSETNLATNYSILNWDEIIELNRDSLITIGSHTINHEILSLIDGEHLQRELADSRSLLESKIDADVREFAYPNGRIIDFNDITVKGLINSGYRLAVTAEPGFVSTDDSLYKLSRVAVGYENQLFPFYNE